MQWLAEAFLTLDFFGSVLSLATVYLASIYHRSTWVVAMSAILINGSMYFQYQVWGHFFLDIFYAFSSLYGWRSWKSQNTPRFLLQTSPFKGLCLIILLIVSSTFLKHLLLSAGGQASFYDAIGTTCALAAQILTCLSYCESWPLWVIHDMMNLAIDLDRNLPFHALKECLYLALAFKGWIHWTQLIKEPNVIKPSANL